jgi:ABC-2 type transport system ATP-binding protein
MPEVLAPDPVTVRVEGVCKKFGNFQALDNVSFEIRKGEVLGFLGPNGAGKTTTMRILTGYFPPTEGKVWIGETEIRTKPHETKRRIGYLPETVNLYGDMKVVEYLEFVAEIKNVSRAKRNQHLEEKLTRCGLWDVRQKMIGHLSKGYRQRVGLAQALVGDPEVVVLDEPTNGLDPKQIIEIRELIKDLGREHTIILSTHILPEVSMICSRVLIMNQGRIVASGTTEELEAGLKKAFEIYVLIGGVKLKDQALDLLKTLPGVERVNVAEEKNDQVGISLMVSKGEDLRPEISRLFVKNHIPLLEIRSGRLSLEEIFMKIVLSENPPKAAS